MALVLCEWNVRMYLNVFQGVKFLVLVDEIGCHSMRPELGGQLQALSLQGLMTQPAHQNTALGHRTLGGGERWGLGKWGRGKLYLWLRCEVLKREREGELYSHANLHGSPYVHYTSSSSANVCSYTHTVSPFHVGIQWSRPSLAPPPPRPLRPRPIQERPLPRWT